ncbi:MAG TPA: P27 family phage terminase small subunit [Caulobacteraceae bacterium]
MALKLSPAAQGVFDRTYMLMEACGILPDIDLLRAYAVAIAELEDAQAQIDANGSVVRIGSTVQVSPYVAIRERNLMVVERLGARLGIDQARMLEPVTKPRGESSIRVRNAQMALHAAGGVVGHAAKLLNVNRRTLVRFIASHPTLKNVGTEIRQSTLDLADTKLLENLRAGNMTAVIWIQKTLGRDRGYVTKDPPATPAPEDVFDADLTLLTDDELAAFNLLVGKLTEGRTGGQGGGPGRIEAPRDPGKPRQVH